MKYLSVLSCWLLPVSGDFDGVVLHWSMLVADAKLDVPRVDDGSFDLSSWPPLLELIEGLLYHKTYKPSLFGFLVGFRHTVSYGVRIWDGQLDLSISRRAARSAGVIFSIWAVRPFFALREPFAEAPVGTRLIVTPP